VTEPTRVSLRFKAAHIRASTRLIIAALASVLTYLALPHSIAGETRVVAAWDGFALVALLLTWTTILTLTPHQICTLAQREDPSRAASLILVLLGAGASLLAVLVLLQESMKMTGADRTAATVLAMSAVVLAWLLIHTVFTLRYAHLYYDVADGGTMLEFPGLTELPDYLDFAYFAFVIGMTAQTADVNIHDRTIRRLALMHGLVAFAFNTAVVALSIGILTSLLQPK
jgi:uncharacterized membrane protein